MSEYILSKSEMQEMDSRMIRQNGVSSELLMEIAGARCAEIIARKYPNALIGKTLILCGSGNNGGDGFVIARHLQNMGYQIETWLPLGEARSLESKANLARLKPLNIPLYTVKDNPLASGNYSLIIDALYGIGFKGDLPKELQSIFQDINALDAFKIAIDIPSGIEADSGSGTSIKAHATIAIENYKYAHYLPNSRAFCGKLHRISINIPESFKSGVCAQIFTHSDLQLPARPPDSHKGSFGKVMLFGGSALYPGSIQLSAQAALKSGAGLIYLYTRKEVLSQQPISPEIISRAIPENKSALPCARQLKPLIKGMDCFVVGPGMATDAYAAKLLESLLKNATVPVLLDADALNLLSQKPALKEYLKRGNIILSPHLKEFSRLVGISLGKLKQDILKHIRAFLKEYPVTLLLKDHISIAAQGNEFRFLAAGNDALATGGSGDVLSGIIGSFIAQGMAPFEAAISASLLMGHTADKLSANQESFSICPSQIIEHLGDKDE